MGRVHAEWATLGPASSFAHPFFVSSSCGFVCGIFLSDGANCTSDATLHHAVALEVSINHHTHVSIKHRSIEALLLYAHVLVNLLLVM
ncbi:unnamed protein product [Camellia sinensis]